MHETFVAVAIILTLHHSDYHYDKPDTKIGVGRKLRMEGIIKRRASEKKDEEKTYRIVSSGADTVVLHSSFQKNLKIKKTMFFNSFADYSYTCQTKMRA